MDLLTCKYLTNEEAKTKIKHSILNLTRVVTSTMGPRGNTVIIPDFKEYGKFTVTKDGVSVVKSYVTNDVYENIIVGLVKQVAEETVKEAGDGTTTSMLFVEELVKNIKEIKFDSTDDQYIDKVVQLLYENSIKTQTSKLYDIAKVSSNGDEHIAKTICEAYTSRYTTVSVERGNNTEDRVISNEGLLIATSPLKGFEHRASSKGIEYTNALVAVTTERIVDHKKYLELFKLAKNQMLLLIAPMIDNTVVNVIKSNNLNVVVVKTPGVADHRENLCLDIATYLGVPLITEFTDKITTDYAGYASVTVGKYTTVKKMHEGEDKVLLDTYIQSLEDKKEDQDDYTIELLEQRISRLKGSNSTIYVGGLSEVEQSERFDRYEDAVRAVKCALEEGLIQGGGVALKKISLEMDKNNKLTKVITAPYDKISGSDSYYTYNNLSEEIVDPVKVTVTALTRAYNFVKTIKSTNAILLGNYNG